jgi:hypothetical protein
MRGPTEFERPTRRAREVNWGDRTKLAGSEAKTLAWVSVAAACPMIVYATAALRGPSAGVACVVSIEWGHGGASVAQDFPLVHRLRVPLAASMVKVSGRLLDAGGNAPPATVRGEVSVVIATGLDGESLRNTQWVADGGAEGDLWAGPARVMRVEGYNAGSVDTWVMVFDGRANNGDAPVMARPVRAGRAFTIARPDSQAFRTSVTWAASSTPLLLTKDTKARVRIDAEVLL